MKGETHNGDEPNKEDVFSISLLEKEHEYLVRSCASLIVISGIRGGEGEKVVAEERMDSFERK